jgi:hypothetical protein
MTHKIDNQYRYGIVYNLDGKIVGFNLSPDVYVPITDIDIEMALENYITEMVFKNYIVDGEIKEGEQ